MVPQVPSRRVAATSSFTRSVPRIPSRVFSRIGHTQVKKMIHTFISTPMPNTRMTAGSSAGAGST